MSGSWWKGQRGEWYVVWQFILFAILFVTLFLTPQWTGWPSPWNMVGMGLGLLLALAGVLFIFFDIKSRREENALCCKFENYGLYQQRVRKLIPYLY